MLVNPKISPANGAVFLASHDGKFINGDINPVDCGFPAPFYNTQPLTSKKAGPHFSESQLLFVFISLFIDHHAIVDYGFGRLRLRQAVQ